MSKQLTAAAVQKLRAAGERREIPDAGAPGLYLIVQPTGAKSWAMRFRRPGSKVSAKLKLGPVDLSGREAQAEPVIGTPLTLAAARALVAELQRQRQRGRDPAADHLAERRLARVAEDNTFAAAARQFVDEYTVPKRGRKPRPWRENARYLGLDYSAEGGEPTTTAGGLAERWRDRPISDVTGADVYAVVDEARRRGVPGLERRTEGVSDARGRKMADALGSMFGWLHAHRRIAADPTAGAWRPPAPASRDRVLNTRADVRRGDELRWFWSATESVGEPFGAMLRLLLLTGCRRDEISRMERRELADDSATLRLPGARTKNGREHVVPLPPLAREILAGVRRIENCPYVFSTTGRTPVSGFSRVKARLDAAMLAAARSERGRDFAVEPWCVHDLRRTAATGMAGIGVPPHVVEAVLNHVSGAKGGVAGVYNREEYAAEKKAALERWAAHVLGVVAGRPARVVPMRKPRGT